MSSITQFSSSPRTLRRIVGATAAFALLAIAGNAFAGPAPSDDLARGRYLVKIGGCNDCHTAGYAERGGNVPESDWLTGLPVGFKGPWGTTYAANLRISLGGMSEEQWMKAARAQRLPPMPWFALRDMQDGDLRAIYRYVRSLGVAGSKMPAVVAPGVEPATPYLNWIPQFPNAARTAANAGKPVASR
jgi:mono/diheme cytochrome c family protein